MCRGMGRLLTFLRRRVHEGPLDNREFPLTLTLRQPEIVPARAHDVLTPELLEESDRLLDETMAELARKDDDG